MQNIILLAALISVAQADTTLFESQQTNPDQTVTILKPRLVRGDREYPFASRTAMRGVCKALGFDDFLEQSSVSYLDVRTTRAYVFLDGNFQAIGDFESRSIESIACFNGAYRTTTTAQELKINPDGTTTILGPKLLRANREYPFGSKSSLYGICQALGFESYLAQSVRTTSDVRTTRAYVYTDGSYQTLADIEHRSVQSLTCYDGEYSSVTRDVTGKYYFRRNP